MLTYITGEPALVAVPLARDGEPFLADDGSLSWVVRDHEGLIIPGQGGALDAADTQVLVSVPALVNTIAAGRQFEKRFLTVNGTSAAVPFRITIPYRVSEWLNHTVSEDAVRAFIGTDSGELPDVEIDLPAAYYEISTLVGGVNLKNALNDGGNLERLANNAIKGQAVLNALPGMQARMSKREEDGVMKVERFQIDFDAIALAAKRLIAAAIRDVGLIDDNASAPTLFMLTTPTPDPVTGA